MIFIDMFSYVPPLKSYDLEIILDKQSVIDESNALLKFSHHQLYVLGSDIILETIFENSNTEVSNKTEDITDVDGEQEYRKKYIIKVKEGYNEVHVENHVISIRIPCVDEYKPLIEIIKKSIKGVEMKIVEGSIFILTLHISKCNEFSTASKNCFKAVKQHLCKKRKVLKEIKNVKIRINFDKQLVFINENKSLIKYSISKYTIRTYKSMSPIKELISKTNSISEIRFMDTLNQSPLPQIKISTSPRLSSCDNKTYIIFECDSIDLFKDYEINIINVNILILNTEDNKTRLYTCEYQNNIKTISIPIKNKSNEEDVHFNYFEETVKHIGALNTLRARLKKELNTFLKNLRILIETKKAPIKEKQDISDLNKIYDEILNIFTNFTYSSIDLLKSNCLIRDQSLIDCLEKAYENNALFKDDQKHFNEIQNFFITKILPTIKAFKIALSEYKVSNRIYKLNEINKRFIQYSNIIFTENNKFSFIITFAIKKRGELKILYKNYLTVSRKVHTL